MNGEYKKTAKHSPLMASENRPSSQLVVNYGFLAWTMLNEDGSISIKAEYTDCKDKQ